MDYPELECFLNESLSDVVFVIEGQRLPAIKSTLGLKSRVFRAMFSGKFSESKESKLPEIPIKDTTFDAFKTLIRFIYTEQLVFKDQKDFEHICEVYILSDRYEVLRLRQRVGQHFDLTINLKDLTPISRIVFAFSNEELISKIMTFIEKNINELIQRDVKQLKELNDSTNDKLLDVLTGDRLDYNSKLIFCYIGDKWMGIKKEMLQNKSVLGQMSCYFSYQTYSITEINSKSFDALKTFVGYLYFDKLILKDEEDLQLIREVCRLAEIHIKYIPFDECIGTHLQKRITVENLELISGIAFDYNLDSLKKCVIDFTKENFTEIVDKSKEILIKINDSTDNSLLEVFAEYIRKTLRK